LGHVQSLNGTQTGGTLGTSYSTPTKLYNVLAKLLPVLPCRLHECNLTQW
jgi:hypothetical protein